MYSHLVAVEVCVEGCCYQRVELDGAPFNENRLKSLDAQAVKCGGTVEQHRSLLAAIVLQQRSDVTFLVVGDGPLRAALEDRARSSGIAEKLRFLGTRSDIPDIFSATDDSVLTSTREGFPNALIESMCLGVPVVTTDYKAATELISDGKEGFIVPGNNPAALAEKINKLLNEAQLRSHIGLTGKKMVEERFSPSAMVQTLVSIYRRGMES